MTEGQERARKVRKARRRIGWTRDPQGVRRNILDVARREFARKGLAGARVDEIAALTSTSKRMIYYYFGDKQGLYVAVLEEAYQAIRRFEAELQLASLPPVEAMERLVGASFDYHADHPEFVRLVMVENIHDAQHLKKSATIHDLNVTALATLQAIYARGVAAGLFRNGLQPLDLFLTLSALTFYNVSNRATIAQVLRHDMGDGEARIARRAAVIDAVLAMIRA